MASLSSVAALLFVAVIHVNGASTVYPLPSTLYGTNQQICNYQFAVPPGSNCVRTGQDLKQQITALQDDVQRTKLSNVQQNTILQEQIDKLNKQAAVTDAGVADLTREFRNLQATIAALQATVTQLGQGGGGGGSGSSSGTGTGTTTTNIYNNAAMQQLVTQTRTQLTTDILRLETEINRVKRDHQQDSIQQSKVDSAFQAQLQQQQQDEALLRQDLRNLQNIVNGLSHRLPLHPVTAPPAPVVTTAASTTTKKTTTTSTAASTTANLPTAPVTTPGSTTPNPLLTQLQASMQALDTRLQQLEQNFQTDVADLKKNMTDLQVQSQKQSLNVSNVATELDYVMNTLIPDLDKRVSTNYGAIGQLNQFRNTQYQALENQVQKVAQNVSSLMPQITALGTKTLTQMTSIKTNERAINDLKTQVHLLASRLTRIQNAGHITVPAPTRPPTTQPPPTTTPKFVIPTPRPHNG